MQDAGIDYEETFAPVMQYVTLRLFFAVTCMHTMQVHQIDVERAFAYAPMSEIIYVRLHPGSGSRTLLWEGVKNVRGVHWHQKLYTQMSHWRETRT